jgi:thiol-disulfide isomerase/thioredoxin
MTRPDSRLALLAPLAGAAALLLLAAPLALAKGTGTGKPPAAAPAAKPAGSYAELLADFARREAEHEKATRKARYDAVAAFVAANGTAKDAEVAREALVDLAGEAGDAAAVLRHADEFLAAHPASASKVGVRFARAAALADLGKLVDAKKAYEELAAEAGEDKNRKVGIVVAHANALADFGDVEGARALLMKIKEEIPEAGDFVDRQLVGFEPMGTDPTAFPDGVKDLDGKAVALADYKGKLLFIDFWATWCGPCVREIPHVVDAYERFQGQGFDVLGVTLDGAEDAGKVRLFAAEHRMPWRQQHDSAAGSEGNTLANAYGVESIPHTILLGRDGKILRVGLRGDALAHTVARTLAREKAAPAK